MPLPGATPSPKAAVPVPADVVTAQPPGDAVAVREGVVVGLTETEEVGVLVGEAPMLTLAVGVGVAVGVGQRIWRTTCPPWSAVKTAEEAGEKATPLGEANPAAKVRPLMVLPKPVPAKVATVLSAPSCSTLILEFEESAM